MIIIPHALPMSRQGVFICPEKNKEVQGQNRPTLPMEKCVMNPERDCLGSAKVAVLTERVERLEEWRDKSSKFHNDFYDWQRGQIARDARLDEQLKNMSADIAKVLAWQESQQAKPARRWENMIDKVLWAVLAAVIAFLLGRVGL